MFEGFPLLFMTLSTLFGIGLMALMSKRGLFDKRDPRAGLFIIPMFIGFVPVLSASSGSLIFEIIKWVLLVSILGLTTLLIYKACWPNFSESVK